MPFAFDAGALGALASVIIIDLVLAGDNAIVVGMAAARLPLRQRRRVIAAGIGIATALRIGLSLIAMRLLAIIGLTLAGGILLLWVAWKFYREMRRGEADSGTMHGHAPPPKSFGQALLQVVLADLSMSLDNVLAIAGAARERFFVLVTGLLLSVALMAVASDLMARLMLRYRWIGWVGLAIVTAVALLMIRDGTAEVLQHAFGDAPR